MIIEERLKNLPLIESIKGLPQYPGVYLLKGSKGEVLYIGKAKNIRSRVRSYFRDTTDTRYTVKFLASKVSDIEYLITTNEKEALILEDTLLKKYKPRYNIRLKDDKTYVSIKLTLSEKYPRILITRQIKKEGGRSPLKPAPACFKRGVCGDKYFGPYASAQKARETVKFTRRLFPMCTCSPSEFRNRVRPCLDYQLGICSAPCVNFISEAAYRELVDKTILFLEGRNRELLSALKANMLTASDSHEFEKAAKLRDQIAAIEATLEEQKVVSVEKIDRDIFAHIVSDGDLLIQGLFVKDGRLSGARAFFFKSDELPAEEALSSFLAQYYSGDRSLLTACRDRFIPDEIILSLAVEDKETIEDWPSEKKGKKVGLFFPAKRDRFKLLKMADANAKESIKRRKEALQGKDALLDELKKRLHLKKTPKVIEAFDISNISGKLAVGAMVTFEDAKPNKNRYRLYKIKTIKEPDDYGMLKEVLFRRYKKADKELGLPDLILMDGGKGQLNIALTVMGELGINDIDIAAIAKEGEEKKVVGGRWPAKQSSKSLGEKIYLPNVKDPIILKEGSAPDLFMRKIRDEVHRFAIRYHKKLRGKIKSVLEEVSGIGKKRRDMLLKHFGSLEMIKQASVEDIARVSGITISLAEDIKKTLTAGNA